MKKIMKEPSEMLKIFCLGLTSVQVHTKIILQAMYLRLVHFTKYRLYIERKEEREERKGRKRKGREDLPDEHHNGLKIQISDWLCRNNS